MSKTLTTTGFLFAILIMAFLLNYFFTVTRVPLFLANILTGLSLPPAALFAIIIIMYIILGAVMDALAMVVITIPLILPLILGMGMDD
ncbi:TRAP-type C4-dicarboxylate transport system permease large subunit [Neobacillus niacini]|nr:TRAP-type C4-dicarboxylate transport system permease large subunit [Neobacillus niacini]